MDPSFLQETHAAISLAKSLYTVFNRHRGLYCAGTEHFTCHQNRLVHWWLKYCHNDTKLQDLEIPMKKS